MFKNSKFSTLKTVTPAFININPKIIQQAQTKAPIKTNTLKIVH